MVLYAAIFYTSYFSCYDIENQTALSVTGSYANGGVPNKFRWDGTYASEAGRTEKIYSVNGGTYCYFMISNNTITRAGIITVSANELICDITGNGQYMYVIEL